MEKYRIVEGIGAYFVTFSVVEWLPVFIDEIACNIIAESLNFCISNKFLRVNAYVIMPTHMHAVLFDSDFDTQRLQHTLDDLRKFTGRQLADHCDKNLASVFGETLRKRAGKDRERRFWQPTKHPEGIFTEKFYVQKVNYIHLNPVRKGLVRFPEDWRFSSAAYWLRGDAEASDVKLSEIFW
jgi:putative transposase